MDKAVHILLAFGALVVGLAILAIMDAHGVHLVSKLAGLFVSTPATPAGA